MIHLHRRREQDHVDFLARDGFDRGAQRAEILRQTPFVNRNRSDLRAALREAGEQIRIGNAVFLHGHAASLERHSRGIFVQRAQNFAPGIGFGRGQGNRNIPFLSTATGFGPRAMMATLRSSARN